MPAPRPPTRSLSNREARWLRIEAQGLATPRPAKAPSGRAVLKTIESLGVLQLDAVNVLERTQFIVPFSRLGPYDVRLLHQLTGPGGALYECWAHAASLVPMTAEPLLRWRRDAARTGSEFGPKVAARVAAVHDANTSYRDAVLAEVRARGPLAASALSDPRRNDGEWWDRRSAGRRALERLFAIGEVAAWRTPTFERVYDVPERVLSPAVLATPTPAPAEAQRELLRRAAAALGVGTLKEIAGYYGLKPAAARPRVAELVEAGEVVATDVEGLTEPAYSVRDARPRPPRRQTATLLAPFDSLFWSREQTRQLFGFDYRLEIYVPEPERRHGYYVLPLLLGDRLVARFDLKADRKASTLLVQASHLEAGADPALIAPLAAAELDAMRSWLALGDLYVKLRGDFAAAIRRAIR